MTSVKAEDLARVCDVFKDTAGKVTEYRNIVSEDVRIACDAMNKASAATVEATKANQTMMQQFMTSMKAMEDHHNENFVKIANKLEDVLGEIRSFNEKIIIFEEKRSTLATEMIGLCDSQKETNKELSTLKEDFAAVKAIQTNNAGWLSKAPVVVIGLIGLIVSLFTFVGKFLTGVGS